MTSRPRKPEPRPKPRLYLITPPIAEPSAFSSQLRSAIDAGDIAAILLQLAEADERTQINRIKAVSEAVQAHGVALLVDGHFDMVARAGADGTHITGVAAFSEAINRLKPERIVGAGGLASRHDAMFVAEHGADYVMFGEPDRHRKCPSFAAVIERISWWAELFEVPCIGYAPSIEDVALVARAGADFVALGDNLWASSDIVEAIRQAHAHLRLAEPAT
jgi:thiamine-phosphate pyrophosphorylase